MTFGCCLDQYTLIADDTFRLAMKAVSTFEHPRWYPLFYHPLTVLPAATVLLLFIWANTGES